MAHDRMVGLRIALFVFGFCVVVVGVLVLLPYGNATAAASVFTMVNATVLYLLVFGALALGESVHELTAGRIASIGVIWRGLIPYALLSIGTMYLANASRTPHLDILCLVQLAGAFGMALSFLLGKATEEHVSDVERVQTAQLMPMQRLRSKAGRLVIAAEQANASDGTTYGELASLLRRVEEELRYTTPVPTQEAAWMEERIAGRLDDLSTRLEQADMGPAGVAQACGEARELLGLIAQRRALRN